MSKTETRRWWVGTWISIVAILLPLFLIKETRDVLLGPFRSSYDLRTDAHKKLASALVVEPGKITIDSIVQLNLTGDKDSSEWLIWATVDSQARLCLIDVSEDPAKVILNHGDYELLTEAVRIGSSTYIMQSSVGGNAAVLDYAIYSYDGIGYLTLKFSDAIASGGYKNVGNRLIIDGRGGKHEIIESNGALVSKPLEAVDRAGNPTTPNVLTLITNKTKSILIYNGDTLGRSIEGREYWINPIHLALGDRVVWNPIVRGGNAYMVRDFIPAHHRLELLMENDYRVFRAIKSGLDTMMVDNGTAQWFFVPFVISGSDSIEPIGIEGKAWKEIQRYGTPEPINVKDS